MSNTDTADESSDSIAPTIIFPSTFNPSCTVIIAESVEDIDVTSKADPVIAPVTVKFLPPVKSLFESKITALEAIAFPTAVSPRSSALSSPTTAVMPSSNCCTVYC